MRRIEPELIGDLLRRAIEESDMAQRLDEYKAIDAWRLVVGDHIASITDRPYVHNHVMIIGVPSAPLRHELQMNKTSLLRLLNQHAGSPVIHDLRFK